MIVSLLEKSLKEEYQQSIGDLLNIGEYFLEENGKEKAQHESIVLMSYLLNRSKSELFLNSSLPVSPAKREIFFRWLIRRREGTPIQHITGYQNFMGLEFKVSEKVLIPRPETEILVEEVIQRIRAISGKKHIRLMDIGVGSGIIPVTICHYFKNKDKYIDFHAVDISADAIELASKNAQRILGINNIVFHQGDLFYPFLNKKYHGTFDGIISNPPYISNKEWESLSDEVRLFDPPLALLGGIEGIDFYKSIIKESPSFLKPGGFLALEIGHKQKKDVCRIVNGNDNFQKEITTLCDYHQNDRVVIALRKN